jgi:hypothetical protein
MAVIEAVWKPDEVKEEDAGASQVEAPKTVPDENKVVEAPTVVEGADNTKFHEKEEAKSEEPKAIQA